MPASSGLMGILPSHAPTVAQMRPGVVEVHDGDDKETYFISSGFAFVHKDRTDVCAVEAVPVSFLNHCFPFFYINVSRNTQCMKTKKEKEMGRLTCLMICNKSMTMVIIWYS